MHLNKDKCFVYLLTDGTSAKVPVNYLNSDDVQSLAADDVTGSVSRPSASYPAEICATDTSAIVDEFVPREPAINDRVSVDYDEDNSQTLVLECNSESEFSAELPVSSGENVRLSGSMSVNKRRGRPKSRRMSSFSVPMMMDYELTPRLQQNVQPVRRDSGKKSVSWTHAGKHQRCSVRLQDRTVKRPDSDVRVQCKFCKSILTKRTAYKCVRCTSHLAQTSMKRKNGQRLTTASKCLRNLSKYRRCDQCGYHLLSSTGGCRNCKNLKTGSVGSGTTSCHKTSVATSNKFHLSDCLLISETADNNVDEILSLLPSDDSLRSLLREDKLIRQYALLRLRSLGDQECENSNRIYDICQELRALAQLLSVYRTTKPSANLYKLIHPDHFNLVIAISRKQPAKMVDILGRVVNIKIVITLQQDDYVAARHAWNFHELLVLWQSSSQIFEQEDSMEILDEQESIEDISSHDQHQLLTQVFDQEEILEEQENVDYNAVVQAEPVDMCSVQGNNSLLEANELTNAEDSSEILGVDVYDSTEQICSSLPYNNNHHSENTPETTATSAMMEDESTDADCMLGDVTNDVQCPVSSDTGQHSNSPPGIVNKCQVVGICESSRENSYCYYCSLPQSEIQHHLKFTHGSEKEITELASLTSDTARIRSLRKLTHLGNHRHNQKVLQENRGTLVVLYQPKPGARPEHYSPCKGCWNYMTKAELSQHRCSFSLQQTQKRPKRVVYDEDSIQVVSMNSFYGSDKTAICYFCGQIYTKVHRHWQCKHLNEPEVIQYMSLGLTDNKAKRQYAAKLRNLAAHEHNVKVLKEGRGQFFVARWEKGNKPSKRSKPSDYLLCENCWSYLTVKFYCQHQCMADREQKFFKPADAHFVLPTSQMFVDRVEQILDKMTDGNVKLTAASDPLIREYVAKLLSLQVRDDVITTNARLLAGFLLEIRKITGHASDTLSSCISPQNFQRCVLAIKSLSRAVIRAASRNVVFTRKMLTMLRQLSKLLKRDPLEKRDMNAVKDLDRFAALCMSESESISADTLVEEGMNSDVELEEDC